MAVKKLLLGLLAWVVLCGQTGPLFNSSQFYELGTCSSTATTCTVSLNNSYSSPSCFAQDLATTNSIHVVCSVSGSTLTISTVNTPYASNCTMSAATTCTFTSVFSGSNQCITDNISATTSYGDCSGSGTTVTVTASASNSNTWHAELVYTNPAPTASHTYAYIVVQ